MKFSRTNLSLEEIKYGFSKFPLKYGINLEIGRGKVVPEIKYFPRIKESLKEEYTNITKEILNRAVDLGVKDLQLETELTYVETGDPKLAGEIVRIQKDIMENYAKEYNINLGLRVTVADMRDFRKVKHDEEGFSKMLETFEEVSKNGADVLSIESEGGKELFNYAIIRQDILGIVTSLGLLSALDMKRLWKEIVKIAKRNNVIAGGDSACAFGNTAMRLAGGIKSNNIPHTLAAVVRSMSASRSLVAYEEGAVGPGKDCAYENVIIKAITGYPMSMEGKSSAVAHSSLVGNIAAATCDLWSNEQVENVRLFGGYGPEVFLEILYYDTKLMNKAIESGNQDCLKEILIESDKYSDPQAYVLSPDIALEIGKTIVSEEDTLLRTIFAGVRLVELMMKEEKLKLNRSEKRFLEIMKNKLEEISKEPHKKVEQALQIYEQKISEYRLKDYF
ncbi:methanol--corrinoid methyltransferase [archaeon]|jgi:methanol--5-hydroxybenzimidazolylcobamide Co-methyltransferase|nr:methanol--corrinoid methyltransferase [archaeon]